MSAMHESRFILHIDLDAFYASIEQRDRPEPVSSSVTARSCEENP